MACIKVFTPMNPNLDKDIDIYDTENNIQLDIKPTFIYNKNFLYHGIYDILIWSIKEGLGYDIDDIAHINDIEEKDIIDEYKRIYDWILYNPHILEYFSDCQELEKCINIIKLENLDKKLFDEYQQTINHKIYFKISVLDELTYKSKFHNIKNFEEYFGINFYENLFEFLNKCK